MMARGTGGWVLTRPDVRAVAVGLAPVEQAVGVDRVCKAARI
jgi:hypothetical protein